MKLPFERREFALVLALLFVAFLVRLAFFSDPGFLKTDTYDFAIWFQHAADVGPRFFYSNNYWCDYPPFNIFIFWIFGSIAKAFSLFPPPAIAAGSPILYILKLPANLFDLATAFVIFLFVRKHLAFKWAMVATALYAFNPAVIFNVAVWGQFDGIYTFFLVFSLFLLFESKSRWAVVAFMLGVLTKPQSIALAPLFFYLVFRKYIDIDGALRKITARIHAIKGSKPNLKTAVTSTTTKSKTEPSMKSDEKGLFLAFLTGITTVFAVILPFEWPGGNPVGFLSNIYFGAYSTYPYTTINAFNFWGFGGMWQSDTQGFLFLTPYVLGWLMFAVLSVFTVYFVHKRFRISSELFVLFGAFVLFFGFFMLPTRMHERYLFPAMAMLALMFPFLKKTHPLYVALTATCFVNQAYVLPILNAGSFIQLGDPVVFIVSLINSLAFVYVLVLMVGELWGKRWLRSNSSPTGSAQASQEG